MSRRLPSSRLSTSGMTSSRPGAVRWRDFHFSRNRTLCDTTEGGCQMAEVKQQPQNFIACLTSAHRPSGIQFLSPQSRLFSQLTHPVVHHDRLRLGTGTLEQEEVPVRGHVPVRV